MTIPTGVPSETDVLASAFDWCLSHGLGDTLVRDVVAVAEANGWDRKLVPSREQGLVLLGDAVRPLTEHPATPKRVTPPTTLAETCLDLAECLEIETSSPRDDGTTYTRIDATPIRTMVAQYIDLEKSVAELSQLADTVIAWVTPTDGKCHEVRRPPPDVEAALLASSIRAEKRGRASMEGLLTAAATAERSAVERAEAAERLVATMETKLASVTAERAESAALREALENPPPPTPALRALMGHRWDIDFHRPAKGASQVCLACGLMRQWNGTRWLYAESALAGPKHDFGAAQARECR